MDATTQTDLDFSIQPHMDIVQETQIKLLAYYIRRSLLEVQGTPFIRFLDTPEEVVGDIVSIILGRTYGDYVSLMAVFIRTAVLLVSPLQRLKGEGWFGMGESQCTRGDEGQAKGFAELHDRGRREKG